MTIKRCPNHWSSWTILNHSERGCVYNNSDTVFISCPRSWVWSPALQIKNTMRCHFKTTEMAVMKRTNNNTCWWGYSDFRIIICCWSECKMKQLPRKYLKMFWILGIIKEVNRWLVIYEYKIRDLYSECIKNESKSTIKGNLNVKTRKWKTISLRFKFCC